MGKLRLLVSDCVLSFMSVWSGALTKLFVLKHLGSGAQRHAEVLKMALSIARLFFFVWLGKRTRGGSYNPLPTISRAISGDFARFLFAVGARIPAQVMGSIIGVALLKQTFPDIGHGPRLNVDIRKGTLTEGVLTLGVVVVSLGLSWKDPKSFFIKTWILSLTKLSLHILGSDLTDGCMNPATAMAWAYARGDHLTREHLLVYWVAPLPAILVGKWSFRLLVQPQKVKQGEGVSDKGQYD